MRRLFLLLLIALVPLRAWAGDAMSVAMAAGGGVAHASVFMPIDCGMQMAHQGADDGEAGSAPADDCDACALCLVATPLPASGGLSAAAKPALPGLANPSFRSSEQSRSLKPPIS